MGRWGLDLSGTTHTNAGDYSSDPWTFTDVTGNYNNANATVHDSIAKANANITITPYNVTYDGNAHTATGSATGVERPAPADLSSLLHLGGTTHTDAGDYSIDSWIFDGNGNYNSTKGTVHDSIAKADAKITVMPYTSASTTYDSNPHTATGTATGVESPTPADLSSLLHLDKTTHTNAGDYPADSWSFDGNGNYNSTSGAVHDSIAKADAKITVKPYSVTYDGNAHTATGTATGVGGVDLSSSLNLSASTHTNAGDYQDAWSFLDVTGNYNAASDVIADHIAKANATIKVNPYSVTYDGDSHTATGTATGVGGIDLSATLTLSGTTHTSAGTYSDTWSFLGGANYNDANGVVNDSIAKAAATISVSGYSGAYDANSHGATGSAKGVKGEDLSALLNLGGSFTDVPGGTAHWTFAGDTNYNAAAGDVNIVITQASASITVNPYSGVYDGNAHGATGTATGVKGESLTTLLNLGASFTDYPGGTASWTFAGNNDYKSASGSAAIVISKAGSTTTVTVANATFDGSQHGGAANVTGVGGLSQSLTVSYVGTGSTSYGPTGVAPTHAGTYQASATFGGDTDHSGSSSSANFTITQASSSTVVSVANATLDGNPHGGTALVTGAGGLNQSLTVSYSGTGSTVYGPTNSAPFSAGTYLASASYAGDNNHSGSKDSKPYAIQYVASGSCYGDAGHQILQPVNADGTSTFKQGSTVPAKFRVCDARGNSIGTLGVVSGFYLIKVVNGTVLQTVDEAIVSTTPDTAFRWDSTNQLWIFNISTGNLPKTNTYYYQIALNDGSSIMFQYGLPK